jgi:hypothetical protein
LQKLLPRIFVPPQRKASVMAQYSTPHLAQEDMPENHVAALMFAMEHEILKTGHEFWMRGRYEVKFHYLKDASIFDTRRRATLIVDKVVVHTYEDTMDQTDNAAHGTESAHTSMMKYMHKVVEEFTPMLVMLNEPQGAGVYGTNT